MFKLESTYDYRNLMMYEDRVADIYWSQILKTVNKLCPEPYLYYYTSISAKERGYSFDTGIDSSKINTKLKIKVTKGQLDYELALLKQKLKRRSITQYERINSINNAEPNPLFEAINGPIEEWERVKGYLHR